MKRLQLFKDALSHALDYQSRFPSDPAIRSVLTQLEFLIELENGNRHDRERLGDIIIGVLTVREIEPVDQSLADRLFQVVEEVELMKSSRSS